MDYGTAAIPVAAWISMATVGLIVCNWALIDALADWQLQRRQYAVIRRARALTAEERAFEMTGRRDVTDELARVIIQWIAFGIGTYALSLQSPHQSITRPGVIISSGLIAIEFILILKSLHDRRVRHGVIALLMEEART